MTTFVLSALAIGMLQISVTYRHALLFKKAKFFKLLFMSFLLALINALMAYVALIFTNAVGGSLYFRNEYAALFILLILAFKAYFNMRKSKLAENIFDITQFKILLMLGVATSFEVFIAVTGASLIEVNLINALITLFSVSLFFSLLGFLAGRRPNQITSIRVFILLASAFYLLAAISIIFILL